MSEPVIRPLSGLAEREACVTLQEEVWGPGLSDRVPASVLMIALETGGVASGAFDEGRLVGFVFGITGLRDGRPIHWSDMLAVDPAYRGAGIGLRLKLHQRELLLDRGVDRVVWTFDPLEAGNAHLNLRRLGAVVREYRRDVYGASDSPLHAGIGTDRLLAEWPIRADRVADRVAGLPPDAGSEGPTVNPAIVAGSWPRPGRALLEPTAPSIRIAVPSDMQGLKSADLGAAVEWRNNVRAAFERAFERGYAAVDFERGEAVGRYVLVRGFSL